MRVTLSTSAAAKPARTTLARLMRASTRSAQRCGPPRRSEKPRSASSDLRRARGRRRVACAGSPRGRPGARASARTCVLYRSPMRVERGGQVAVQRAVAQEQLGLVARPEHQRAVRGRAVVEHGHAHARHHVPQPVRVRGTGLAREGVHHRCDVDLLRQDAQRSPSVSSASAQGQGLLARYGMSTAVTAPRAERSGGEAAATAESMPPDSPRTTRRRPTRSTSWRRNP